jgi:GxxExxY protein
MPIIPSIKTRRITQDEFGELSYEVMQHVFAIHTEFGRFFDEKIYKRELATRMKDVQLEVPVDVTHKTFSKHYQADVIVGGCGLFEFKAAEAIHPKHRGQTIHYLLLFDLPHGKIVNLRTEQVQHEFVNCHHRLTDLRHPQVLTEAWDTAVPGADLFCDTLVGLVRDWGTGLEVQLYEEAVTHFFGGEQQVERLVPVSGSSGPLGDQRMRLLSSEVAFKITGFTEGEDSFAAHAQKLLRHTPLKAILWANVTTSQVAFRMIR